MNCFSCRQHCCSLISIISDEHRGALFLMTTGRFIAMSIGGIISGEHRGALFLMSIGELYF